MSIFNPKNGQNITIITKKKKIQIYVSGFGKKINFD